MHPATIASVDRSDEGKVVATLVSAFVADPVERWLFAEPLQYLTHFARFVSAFGSGGFESNTVFSLGDFAAVAIWLPPGGEADADAIVAVLGESVPAEQQAVTFSVLEQMDAAHPRRRPLRSRLDLAGARRLRRPAVSAWRTPDGGRSARACRAGRARSVRSTARASSATSASSS